MTPGAGVLVLGHALIVNMRYVYTRAWSRQIKYKAIMTKKGSAKIVNFITIGAEGLMLRLGYMSHYSEYALSSTLSIYIILIAIVLSEYNAAFLCHC